MVLVATILLAAGSAIALGDADEVVVQVPVAPDSPADGQSLQSMCMETETGFYYVLIEDDGTGRDELVPAGSVR